MNNTNLKCPECDKPIDPKKKGDFFGLCSYACLSARRERFEREQDEQAARSAGEKLFGRKPLL